MFNTLVMAAKAFNEGSKVSDSTFDTYEGDMPIAIDNARADMPRCSRSNLIALLSDMVGGVGVVTMLVATTETVPGVGFVVPYS